MQTYVMHGKQIKRKVTTW